MMRLSGFSCKRRLTFNFTIGKSGDPAAVCEGRLICRRTVPVSILAEPIFKIFSVSALLEKEHSRPDFHGSFLSAYGSRHLRAQTRRLTVCF